MTSKLHFMVTRAGGRVLVHDAGLGLVEHGVRARDRWAERWHSAALDRRLAHGETAENDVVLALHAQVLTHPATRQDLSRALLEILELAHRVQLRPSAVRVYGQTVLPAAPALHDVVGRLTDHGPVSAYGIARLRMLLTDGSGPLYRPGRADELTTRLCEVRAALDVLAPR